MLNINEIKAFEIALKEFDKETEKHKNSPDCKGNECPICAKRAEMRKLIRPLN